MRTFANLLSASSNAIAVLIGLMFSTSLAQAQLTRQQAVDALFAPGSGVAIDPTNSVVWSPFVDFGSGAGFEGLLPAGSTVEPQELGWLPWPGPGHAVTAPAYFFWIDDAPDALFQHPVRFVLVQAAAASPTVANGGIVVSAQGWWPAVTTPGGVRTEFFATDQARATDQPPGFANPHGHIAGPAGHPSQLAPGAAPLPAAAPFAPAAPAPAPNNACGLIIRGSPDAHMGTTAMFYESDLRDHYRVPTNRIIKANGGMAATCAQVDAAISNLCNLMPPCDKIYVRLVSHGSIGGFTLADGSISASNLCVKFRKLAVKGVPICLVINSCYSGSLLTDPLNWNFPAGSSIITATDSNHQARGSSTPYTLGANTNITGSLYPHAFSACLRDARADRDGNGQVDDCEAFDWVRSQKPCYIWSGDGGRRYPGGPPAGQVGENPGPQKILVGRNPSGTALTVCNGTGADKTDFHIVYQGNVTNGLRARSTRALQDGTPFPQLGWTNAATITYDSTNDQTMVCWSDTNNPVAPGSYVNFIVVDPQRRLRPVRQFWTPSAVTPPPTNRAPGQRAMLLPGSTPATARVLVTAIGDGDDPQATMWRAMTATAPIPEGNLYGSSPAVQVLVSTDLGAFEVSPNQSAQFDAPVTPMPNAPLPTLILRSDSFWEVNSTRVTALYQLNLDTPAEDTTCLTNCPGTGVFFGVNPPGPNPTFQWFKDGQLIEGETNGTLRLLDLRGIDQGTYTGIATSGTLVKRRFFKLFIEDNSPPTLICPTNIIAECAGPDGTPVNYLVSASDNCSGLMSLKCEPPPGSLFPLGTTFVNCIARDTFQNSAVCTFEVNVVDTTPPELSCISDRVFTSASPIIFVFSTSAFDNCDRNPTLECDPRSGSTFLHGTTPVTCTAIDAAGNTASCTFTVTVRRPGDSTLDVTRQGSTLTVTWTDAGGLLQGANSATGPWLVMTGAVSPTIITIDPNDPEHYFRLLFPEGVSFLQGIFNHPDPAGANAAYGEFFNLGADAIDPLIQLTGSSATFAGGAYKHPGSSRTEMMAPSVRLTAIYLVDGILLGSPTPHYAPALISDTPMSPGQMEQQAAQRYQQWWNQNRGRTLDQLRAGIHPLTGSGLRWHGPLLFDAAAPAEGNEVAGSSTPYNRTTNNPCLRMLDGADADSDPDPYAWEYKPRRPDGPKPYNCFAWGLNCYNDRWLDTPVTRTAVWEQALRDHGYKVADGPVDCAGACPEGRGPKIKVIFHVKEGEAPSDANWVHVMKQEADGDWSSKNGEGPLFENIKDCEKFLDKHYKVPAGQLRVTRCYCK